MNLNNWREGVAHGTMIIDLIIFRIFGGQKFVNGWEGEGSAGMLIALDMIGAF